MTTIAFGHGVMEGEPQPVPPRDALTPAVPRDERLPADGPVRPRGIDEGVTVTFDREDGRS